MGNQVSNHEAGNSYIQTDQAFYIAGDTVTGKVHLHLIEMYPGNTLHLKIKGFETAEWKEKKTREKEITGSDGIKKTEHEVYYETHTGKNSFYSHQFPLYVWTSFSYMPPGQYTFPFQFKLTENLPGTYEEKGKHEECDYQAVIKYKVKAEITANGAKKIKSKQILVVREPLKTMVTSQFGEKHVKPSTWCCISQGESHIRCQFERNSYLPGETARVLTEIDNSQCDLEVKKLSCNFVKYLTLHSNAGKEVRIVKNVQTRDFAGVGARQKAMNENTRAVEVALISNSNCIIQPSTKGRLVHCEYKLNVFAELEGCICCSSAPEVTVPVSLVSPPPINYGVVNTPPNWNPQVFEVKNFAFSNETMYTKSIPMPQVGINMNMPAPSMNVNMNMPAPSMNVGANFSGPSMKVNSNIGAPQMNVKVGVPGMQMNMGGPDMHINVGGPAMHMNMGGPDMHVNVGAPAMRLNMGGPDMHVNVGAPAMHVNMGGPDMHVNVGAPAMHLNMGGPDMRVNMNVSDNHGPQMNMNMNMGVMTTDTHSNNGLYSDQTSMNIGMPGMNMTINSGQTDTSFGFQTQENVNVNFGAHGGGFNDNPFG